MTETTIGTGLAWLGFWLFMAVLVYAAHVQYMAGHDTAFFKHKTGAEKTMRDRAAGLDVPEPAGPLDEHGRPQ